MRKLLIALFALSGYLAKAQDKPAYSIFLVGDAGKVSEGQRAVFDMLGPQLDSAGSQASLLFLGDNIYPQGMPGILDAGRKEAEKEALAQINLAKGFSGTTYVIPGNHDWAQGRRQGWDEIRMQEDFFESHMDSMNVFLPSNGCPGPVEVDLNEEIALIIIDTQWFLHKWDKPDEESGGCASANAQEVLQMLDDMILRNSHKKIIVASHHPMYTYGSHGGVVKLKTHLLPPILGSVYAFYRKYIGSVQDVSNPRYKAMRNAMVSIFEKHPNLIQVAGHEHNLQYSYKDSIHYIVSGAGSKSTYVKKKGYAQFAESSFGFARLDFYKDGRVDLKFWEPGMAGTQGKVAYEKLLMNEPYVAPPTPEEFAANVSLQDSVVTVAASQQYKASKMHKKLLGANYRDVWSAKIEVPVFDIGNEHGGLKIVQRGGGQQTKSLRLQAKDGKQYVLRSIEKYPENAVPEMLRNTFAVDLVQDQISASHPYGALVVPYLAQAAGIYHTNPKLVFIPDDPRLGMYQIDFVNTLALYEERPAHDWSGADFFGNSPDIESTQKVLDELKEDNDNEVDQRFVLKSRLFDLIIGDWDRHDDQWRWSEKDKKGKGKIYRPIPRDRDQAFFVNEGFFPKIWSRKWALPKFEGFDKDVDWPSGLMYNARYFDRSFLTGLSKKDWVDVARELKAALTDEAITYAIKQWPDKVFELGGETIIANLKARRDRLEEYAVEHYLFLSKAVDVVGSDKHEHFQVDRLPNGDVHVVVRKMKKGGELKKIIYDRLFVYGETKEIRLYGLGGEDEFEIEGEAGKSIKVRVIGGPDEDELDDDSKVYGPGKKTVFYDTKTGNKKKFDSESLNRLSYDPGVNNYNRKAFKYNTLAPLIIGNFNQDDGIFIGGGFLHITHGFRKEPYKWRHLVLGSYAVNTSSFNLKYEGTLTDAIKNWNLLTQAELKVPDYTNNFFGLGNESTYDRQIDKAQAVNKPIDYYRLRFREIKVNVGLERRIGAFGRVGIHANYISWALKDFEGRPLYVKTFLQDNGLDMNEEQFNYMGSSVSLAVDTRDNEKIPNYGILWENTLGGYYGIDEQSGDFHRFNTSFSFYHSFRLPARLTFASRTGFGVNFGDYPFFVAQTLGGKYEVRGFRKTRFYGDERFYNNFEVRLKLFTLRTYLFPASLGILAFHDIGRVWLDGEDSDQWHRGVGGGVWFTPFNMAALSAEVGRSDEETLFYIRLGFLF